MIDALRRTAAWCTRIEPLSLGTFLLIAFALRLPAILFARGYEFVDHQFQYVDPAYHLAFDGSWYQSWEWERGMRSWVYPGLLAGLFRIIAALGIDDPCRVMTVVRGVHGLVSLLPLAAAWYVVTHVLRLPRQRPALLLLAASGLVVYSGVQPNGPMFGGNLSVTAVLLCVIAGRRPAFAAGLLLGFAFCCRVQDACFGPVLAIALLGKRRIGDAACLALGASIGVGVQGFVDLATWGQFLHSPFEYLQANVVEGKSLLFGRDPFWLYVAPLVALAAIVPPFLARSRDAVRTGARILPLPLIAALVYVGAHALLERKAVRFLVPALWLWTLVVAVGAFHAAVDDRVARWYRRFLVFLHVGSLVVLSFHYFHRGPVEAALALRARDDFAGKLVLVDDDRDLAAVGGHYYLGRRDLTVVAVSPDELGASLAALDVPSVYLMVCEQPLAAEAAGPTFVLEPAGSFDDLPSFKTSTRRFLYRALRRQ